MTLLRSSLALIGMALLAACGSGNTDDATGAPGEGTFTAIAEGETVHFAGTEPFWSGSAGGGMATYATPEQPEGREFAVERFAGNNGLGISGAIDGAGFDLTITPGECSDGMSDRSYPYTATLLLGSEQRQGCAWTDSQPFNGPEMP